MPIMLADMTAVLKMAVTVIAAQSEMYRSTTMGIFG